MRTRDSCNLLRVLPGLYDDRPDDFSGMVCQPERFLAFVPVGAACFRGMLRVVAEEPIPEGARSFPTFRTGLADASGIVKAWFLWDGEREWHVGRLAPEHSRLPIYSGVWSIPLLVDRIASGHVPSERDLVVLGPGDIREER